MNGESCQRFGPFSVLRTLGRGGMGEVFLARTPWPRHPLAAVKRLRPDVARVPTFAERFAHEAELAVRLTHDHLVSTLDVGSVDGQLYVASELVLGKDAGFIADRLRSRSQGGPAAVAIRLLLDGLLGLAYVHGARDEDGRPLGLVHRDVTPGNLLVGYDGRARLADFGLAKSHLSSESRLTKQGEILGTPHYLAPEVVRGEPALPASDVYGLGAVLYRFLTGVAPYQGSTSEVLVKVLSERPRPLLELRPDLPHWLVEALEAMLARALPDRPAEAGRFAERVMASAAADELLVPWGAVGRWLAQLFDREHLEEVEEARRLVEEVAPPGLEPTPEGTVVLARAVGTAAPASGAESLPSIADDEGRGTELELATSSVLGVSPPVESREDEMPTRAASNPAVGVERGPEGADELDADADDDRTLDGADLPGFVDDDPDEGPPTVPTSGPTPRPSRLQSPGPIPEDTDAQLVTPVEDGSAGRSLPSAVLRVDRPEPTLQTRGSGGGAPAARRPTLLLTGLLALAIAAGIGIGKVAARAWRSPPEAAPLVAPDARARLDALNRRLEAMQAAGRPIPASAWQAVARAASALLAQDRETAESHLDAAEALVEP